jgi:hypothetical protein
MRRLQPSAFNFPYIDRVNPVDKITIPLSLRIEVGSKNTIYENIDDIAKTEKEIKIKAFPKERKNVLGAFLQTRQRSNPNPDIADAVFQGRKVGGRG